MKKLITILIIAVISLLPISAFAQNDAEGYSWSKGYAGQLLEKGDEIAVSDIKASYSSPFFDILPAMKKAVGNDKSVTVEISFEYKAMLSDGNTATKASVLLRGGSNLNSIKPEDWLNEYKNTLNGDSPLFTFSGGNVMFRLKSGIPVTSDWTVFSAIFTFTKAQIESQHIPYWNLGFDGMNPVENILTLQFRNVSITKSNGQASEIKPTPTPVPTPTPDIPARKTPTLTVQTSAPQRTLAPFLTPQTVIAYQTPTPSPSPTPTPTPDWSDQPVAEDMADMLEAVIKITLIIIGVTGVLYICVNAAARKKK